MIQKKHAYLRLGAGTAVLAAIVGVWIGPSPPVLAAGGPPLGAARSFVALGGSSLNNSGLSVFTGDVGVSPGTSVTGFPPGVVIGGAIHAGDAAAAAAHADASIAYAFLLGMASPAANNLTSQDLGGMTLAPGVYKFNTSAQLTGQLRLDAGGDPGALFVLQIGSTLTTASNASVVVINGGPTYDTSNVFWQVGTSATIGSGTSFIGNILASASITVVSGSSMTGNALAINGAVTTSSNTNSMPPLVLPPVVDLTAPINLTATLNGTNAAPRADLRWNDASDYETEFRVYRREGAASGFILLAAVAPVNTVGIGAVVTYQDAPLLPSTTYTYKVTAFSVGHGESPPSNEALVDTDDVVVAGPGVVAPLSLTAALSGTAAGPTAELRWNDASVNETDFRVYRRDGAGPNFALVGSVGTLDSLGTGGLVAFHDPALNVSTTYTYKVTSFSPLAGESDFSNDALVDTANFVPPVVINVVPPLNLTAVLSGSAANPGSVLSWTDASANETEFRVFRRDGMGPNYVQVGSVATTDMVGVGGVTTFNDLVLNPSTTFTYRVTAFSPVDGESAPSNETLIDTGALPPEPPARWLDVHLGRGRGGIRDRGNAQLDRVYVSASYAVIDVDGSVPAVLHDADPRVDGVSVQIRAPGNLALLVVPPNDPGWKVLGNGIYQWKSHDGPDRPRMGIRINTRRSSFRFRCFRCDFGAMPINAITVTLTMFGASGSASQQWNEKAVETGTKALFKLPR